MKNYHIYLFTLNDCAPAKRVMNHVSTLTKAEQAEIDFVPLKTATGERTMLAEELSVELSPMLVVTHDTVSCEIDRDDEEYCELEEESVERFVGANSIIEHLYATLDAYTYAHPD
jgi:hypothetical protein